MTLFSFLSAPPPPPLPPPQYFLRISDLVQEGNQIHVKFHTTVHWLSTTRNEARLNTSRAMEPLWGTKGKTDASHSEDQIRDVEEQSGSSSKENHHCIHMICQKQKPCHELGQPNNVKTSQGLPMRFAPDSKSWGETTTLKVNTGFPPWTWVTWHFS